MRVTFAPIVPKTTVVPAVEAVPADNATVSLGKPVETVASIATIASSVTLGSGTGPAIRLMATSKACELDGEEQRVGRFLHPTQWYPADNEAAGMVLGNLALCAVATMLCFCATLVVRPIAPRVFPSFFTSGFDYIGFLRFPSAPLFVFLLLYQGASLGGMLLLLHGKSWGLMLLGVGGSLVCVLVPAVLAHTLRSGVPSKGVYVMDDEHLGFVRKFIIGPGEWCSTDMSCDWVNRYTGQLRFFKQELSWYILFDFAAAFAISCCLSVKPTTMTGCGHVKLAMGCVFCVEMLLEARFWPHARGRDSAADFTIRSLQAVGMVLFAVGYYTNERSHWAFDISASLLFISGVLLFAKMVLDLLTEVYVLLIGRRNRLQRLVFQRNTEVDLLERDGGDGSPSSKLDGLECESASSDDFPYHHHHNHHQHSHHHTHTSRASSAEYTTNHLGPDSIPRPASGLGQGPSDGEYDDVSQSALSAYSGLSGQSGGGGSGEPSRGQPREASLIGGFLRKKARASGLSNTQGSAGRLKVRLIARTHSDNQMPDHDTLLAENKTPKARSPRNRYGSKVSKPHNGLESTPDMLDITVSSTTSTKRRAGKGLGEYHPLPLLPGIEAPLRDEILTSPTSPDRSDSSDNDAVSSTLRGSLVPVHRQRRLSGVSTPVLPERERPSVLSRNRSITSMGRGRGSFRGPPLSDSGKVSRNMSPQATPFPLALPLSVNRKGSMASLGSTHRSIV
eukprot:TRINITY_DN6865_c0_g3_i1.p1 TRINITY_DN6865_c0_g3~~TRINITY_DN6865_c0_g3_i1.p1  ORF type:complete len:733 (+),score=195.73 TRINITY_DN6865_c0_g3_i1:1-2199(+)